MQSQHLCEMKNKSIILFSVLFIATAFVELSAQQPSEQEVSLNPNIGKDSSKKSIKSMAIAVVKGDSIKINYHSPGVRKRIIWGGLVPYDEVWVTGAHTATTLTLNEDYMINGTLVTAGKYAFFSIPGSTEWTLIINKNWAQHLATDYNEREDVVRIKVVPQQNDYLERLQYFIEPAEKNMIEISVAWEKLKVSFDMMPAL